MGMETLKRVLGQESGLHSMGPCLVIFAVSLLIPGLTLTLVALWDETGYRQLSVLHVLGMALLVLSATLLLTSLVLRCCCSNKGKRRISPQDEEEDSLSRSSSEAMGHVTSTHSASHRQAPPSHAQNSACLSQPPDSSPASPESYGRDRAGREELMAAPSLPRLPPASPGLSPVRGATPGVLTASVPDRGVGGDGGGGRLAQRQSSCNYMLSDSEDPEAEAARYAATATMLLTNSDGQIITTSSSSSSLTSERSSDDVGDAHDSRQPSSTLSVSGHSAGRSQPSPALDVRQGALLASAHHSSSSHTSARSSSSSLEDQCSQEITATHKKVRESDSNEDDIGVGVEPLFMTRQHTAQQRLQEQGTKEHSEESGTENVAKPGIAVIQAENSSRSLYTELPSHGTYSVRSLPSEDLAQKMSHDELSVSQYDEDEVFHSTTRDPPLASPSPVPLRSGRGQHDVIVLGAKPPTTSGSSHRSPGSHTGAPGLDLGSGAPGLELAGSGAPVLALGSSSEGGGTSPPADTGDGEGEGKRKGRKKKKRKKRRYRESSEKTSHWEKETREGGGEGNARPHPSLLRSALSPHHQAEHHVHWLADDTAG